MDGSTILPPFLIAIISVSVGVFFLLIIVSIGYRIFRQKARVFGIVDPAVVPDNNADVDIAPSKIENGRIAPSVANEYNQTGHSAGNMDPLIKKSSVQWT